MRREQAQDWFMVTSMRGVNQKLMAAALQPHLGQLVCLERQKSGNFPMYRFMNIATDDSLCVEIKVAQG